VVRPDRARHQRHRVLHHRSVRREALGKATRHQGVVFHRPIVHGLSGGEVLRRRVDDPKVKRHVSTQRLDSWHKGRDKEGTPAKAMSERVQNGASPASATIASSPSASAPDWSPCSCPAARRVPGSRDPARRRVGVGRGRRSSAALFPSLPARRVDPVAGLYFLVLLTGIVVSLGLIISTFPFIERIPGTTSRPKRVRCSLPAAVRFDAARHSYASLRLLEPTKAAVRT
jgi:hypothetical protein